MLLFAGSFVIAFGVTIFFMPAWIRFAKKKGIVGRDMNKPGGVMVAEAGGVVVIGAVVITLVYFAGVQFFYFKNSRAAVLILGAIGSILGMATIGIVDDFRGWKRGLRQWQKPLLTIPAAIPFLLATFNRTTIDIPFMGIKNVGLVFPLLFVPMAVVGASNAFNMLAGYNGLEAGMGMIILAVFSFLSYLNGHYLAVGFCLVGFFALLAFIVFNWFPAKVFPGDTMTYSLGAFIANGAMLGGVEKFGLLLFIPYFLDFLLTARKKMKVEAFGKVNSDGGLDLPYQGIYDSAHLVIFLLQKVKKKVYEQDVVWTLLGFELMLGVLCVVIRVMGVGW